MASGASRANFERYVWGVTPSLMAWPAVAMGGGPGAFVIACTLGIVYLVDRSFARRRLLPPWYMCVAVPWMPVDGGLAKGPAFPLVSVMVMVAVHRPCAVCRTSHAR